MKIVNQSTSINADIIGNPTIDNEFIVSNFSASDYIEINNARCEYAEYSIKFNVGTSISTNDAQAILHCEHWVNLYLKSNYLCLYNWKNGSYTNLIQVTANTDYWVKIICSGKFRIYFYSLDGINYTQMSYYFDNNIQLNENYPLRFGLFSHTKTNPFYGSIDFKECFIESDNYHWLGTNGTKNLIYHNNKHNICKKPQSKLLLTISSNLIVSGPIIFNGDIQINNGVALTPSGNKISIILKCNKLINNGTINVNGKGFGTSGDNVSHFYGAGYVCGGSYNYGHINLADKTNIKQIGGGAPSEKTDFSYNTKRPMIGLLAAQPGLFSGCDNIGTYGPGYNGSYGGGGGGGCSGNDVTVYERDKYGDYNNITITGYGLGGGSGAGSGGGSAGYGWGGSDGCAGGNGSQSDVQLNLCLFKKDLLEEIPLFGGSGATGWGGSDRSDRLYFGSAYDASCGGGNIQIYTKELINKGTITANGETYYLRNTQQDDGCGGGGGGCIMMRYNTYTNNGTVTANGSPGHYYNYKGGDGGNGLILLDDGTPMYLLKFNPSRECTIQVTSNNITRTLNQAPYIFGVYSGQVTYNATFFDYYTETQTITVNQDTTINLNPTVKKLIISSPYSSLGSTITLTIDNIQHTFDGTYGVFDIVQGTTVDYSVTNVHGDSTVTGTTTVNDDTSIMIN